MEGEPFVNLMRSLFLILEHRLSPRRHGEQRNDIGFLMWGLFFFALGSLFGVLSARDPHWRLVLVIASICFLASFILCAMYFRTRLHFRRYGVFVFRLGRLSGYHLYSDWKGYEWSATSPFHLVLRATDGTLVELPSCADRPGSEYEKLWRLREAGVRLPDTFSSTGGMSPEKLDEYSLAARGKFPKVRFRELLAW